MTTPKYNEDALRANIVHIEGQIEMLREYMGDPKIEEEIQLLYEQRAELKLLLKQLNQ